ncbi:MAG: polysaccharide biosynthesis tyrosine autokinase [Lutibacter sp.]|uniref:GumC family protein n=1 Tax=Lutibacter sp. TaxID=1925666 RepID=UPI0019E27BB9|nr:tyrosine-protein kinase [Lutibacter sp.]NOR28456.1 polysaccharide biosynthesis tyrosine autokinase [Lutibacter sp.]
MNQNENPLNYLFFDEEPIDYREKIEKYVYHWKWFVVGIIVALACAYVYLRYTPREYLVTTTILVDDMKNGGLPSELMAFEDLGLISARRKTVDNEMGLLKSRSLMQKVVKEVGLNVTYYEEGRVQTSEVFQQKSPVKINFFSKDSTFYALDTTFRIRLTSKTNFTLINKLGIDVSSHAFGEKILTNMGALTVTPTNLKKLKGDEEVITVIKPLKAIANSYRSSLKMDLLYEKASLIELSLKTKVKLKGQIILDNLVNLYNKNAVEDKSLIANNTNDFINRRLEVIEKDLSSVDKGVEDFKITNKLTNIASEATLVLQTNSEIEKKIIELNTQLKLANYVTDYMAEHMDGLIPSNLGLADATVSVSGVQLNKLVIERNRLLKSSKPQNPIIVNLNSQIKELRGSIAQSLANLTSSLTISLNDAVYQENRMSSKITSAPKQEREFRDIQRQQQIIETLYLYLLQKREENAISLAATLPNAKIIDKADGSDSPISPKRNVVYMAAAMLGFMVPFLFFYLVFLLDNKVHTLKDIEAVLKAPFLGEIPKTAMDHKIVVNDTERGIVAEAFRMLRTNITFMLSNVKKEAKTIFITSTISEEGKTFIAINTAAVLALSNKKVLLVGADIRKPKINDYLKVTYDKGLTHFLMDNSLAIEDVIVHNKESNFDVLHSGIIAPNPSELLMNGRFEEVLAYGKANYDYVIIDTAPIKIVTDTLLLSNIADLFVYVIRANYLDKRLLEIPTKLYNEKRVNNMAVILNAVDIDRGVGYGYGYGYGYAYGENEQKPWWKKLF